MATFGIFILGLCTGVAALIAFEDRTDFLLARLMAGHSRQSAILSRDDVIELVALARANGGNPLSRTVADYDAAAWLIDVQIDAGNLPESLAALPPRINA